MRDRLLPLVAVALLGALAAGCDGKPAPPTHRMKAGPLAGDPIAGVELVAAPPAKAPALPEPPPVTPTGAGGPAPSTPTGVEPAVVAPAPVEPPVVDPTPSGSGETDPKGAATEVKQDAVPLPPPDDGLPQPPKLPDAEQRKGYVITNFDTLSGYDAGPLGVFGASPKILKNLKLESLVPKMVMDLHGKKVGITGYMIPVDFDKNEVLTFLLCRWQPGCCFGHVPQAHEQVYVEAKPGGGTRFVIVPVTAYGELTVGPKKDADGNAIEDGGEAMSLYRLMADKVDVPKDW